MSFHPSHISPEVTNNKNSHPAPRVTPAPPSPRLPRHPTADTLRTKDSPSPPGGLRPSTFTPLFTPFHGPPRPSLFPPREPAKKRVFHPVFQPETRASTLQAQFSLASLVIHPPTGLPSPDPKRGHPHLSYGAQPCDPPMGSCTTGIHTSATEHSLVTPLWASPPFRDPSSTENRPKSRIFRPRDPKLPFSYK